MYYDTNSKNRKERMIQLLKGSYKCKNDRENKKKKYCGSDGAGYMHRVDGDRLLGDGESCHGR